MANKNFGKGFVEGLFKNTSQTMEEKDIKQEELNEQQNETAAETTVEPQEEQTAEQPKELTVEEQLAAAQAKIEDLEKDRLYKQAEFDNYRKRMMKEKTELILNGGRKVLESMLPVVDDMERALQHMDAAEDVAAVKEGVELILKKYLQTLKSHGVTPMETQNADFNTDYHEAVTQFPAPTPELKGKVIDCTEKGYMLNDTVLRFAKVVVGI